jgi:hypothetical protein
MHGHNPYIPKVMHVFFNMDRMIGKDFEIGLANLKTATETSEDLAISRCETPPLP